MKVRALVAACGSAALLAAGLAALPATAAAAAPVGLIEEIPIGGNVPDITAGPEGDIWFTENLKHRRIGRISPTGKVTKFKPLPKGVSPGGIAAGADGNLWFTYERGGFGFNGGGVGRITPHGKVTLFPEPPDLHGSPFEIVAGPDGSLYFDHAAIFTPTGQAIGRITTAGAISELQTGLSETAAVTNLVAGTDGNVWFADDSDQPAIGKITPSGEITEFPGLEPEEYPILYGPTPTPGGDLYFSANEAHHIAVERITPDGQITRITRGLDPRTVRVGPFAPAGNGGAWFRVERKGPAGQTAKPNGRFAVAHLNGAGKITEFSRCLRPLGGFGGPEQLTPGPEGNLWFATRESGAPGHAQASSTPSIGRVTPTGKITEFRYGLDDESDLDDLNFASGRLWFLDRRTESIGVITPPRQPPNTFLLSFPEKHDVLRTEVTVPGPGTVTIAETGVVTKGHGVAVPGLVTRTFHANACGPIAPRLPFSARLARLLDRRHEFVLTMRVTFKPPGGRPFSRRTNLGLEVRK